jgi:hypothetical protein
LPFQAVLDRAGHGAHVVALLARPAVMLLRLLEALKLSPLYRWTYETADRDSAVSIERLRTTLAYIPRHANQPALQRNHDWDLAHHDEFAGRSGLSHRVPWKHGVLAMRWHRLCNVAARALIHRKGSALTRRRLRRVKRRGCVRPKLVLEVPADERNPARKRFGGWGASLATDDDPRDTTGERRAGR